MESRHSWNYEDLTGLKIGKLTILRRVGTSKCGNVIYECKCDCGNLTTKTKSALKNRKPMCRKCGNSNIARNIKHGDSKTKLYSIWAGMKSRCFNCNTKKYKLYGGRGITVCEEWLQFKNFKEWALNSGYNPNLTKEEQSLDRINCDGNYEPSNCRWVDIKTQNKNRRLNYGKQ